MDNEQSRSVIQYIALFAAIYLFFYTVVSALTAIFKSHFGSYATPFIVGVYTATKFIKENDRLITKVEKGKLVVGTFLCTVIINILNTTNFIGTMSIDHLDHGFVVRQLILLFFLWGIFGPISKYIYYSSKKQR